MYDEVGGGRFSVDTECEVIVCIFNGYVKVIQFIIDLFFYGVLFNVCCYSKQKNY
jgi:hypothetical protein